MMCILNLFCLEPKTDFWDNNIVTIVGLSLGLLFFVIERLLNYNREIREAKHNWFLNIILSPNLENINTFYFDSNNKLIESVQELINNKDIGHNKFILLQREKINEFKIERVKFLNNFSSMIRSYDVSLSIDFDKIINELDDIYTETLDKALINNDDTFSNKIFKNKSKIITLLFNVIKRNKRNKKNQLKQSIFLPSFYR